MKVALIGDRSAPLDEGMKKTTAALSAALTYYCELRVFNPLRSITLDFWSGIQDFHPQVIHYIPGPSLKSFVLLSAIKKWLGGLPTVMSITHPDPHLPVRIVDRFLRPDLLLLQSTQSARQFQCLKCRKEFIPNGVDTNVFYPVSEQVKLKLRTKLEIDAAKFVVLHVGNTRMARNLESLLALQSEGYQVVVIGSTTISGDPEVTERLKAAGCLVVEHYVERIEGYYQSADCYVFPTVDHIAAIQHPLSVLEAMACNLPVVTREFGAIPNLFNPGDGFYLVKTDRALTETVKRVKARPGAVRTREMVIPFSWSAIAEKLILQYERLLISC